MKNSILYFLVFIFFGCSSAKIEIEQEGMLPFEIYFSTYNTGYIIFKNKIQIKNKSLGFVSLKIRYTNAPEGDVLHFLATEYNKKEDRYVRFENETIHLYPLQKKEIYYILYFDIDTDNKEQEELIPYFKEHFKEEYNKYPFLLDNNDKRIFVQFDYVELKKNHPKLLEHLTKGFDTIEVRVLKPKEEVFYFPAKW